MFQKTLFYSLLSLSLFFNGCSDNSEEVNSILSTNEYVLTSTDNTQYIVKKQSEGFVVSSLEDKVVIFDIFATWCPPCQDSASHLSALQEKYKDDLIILGVTIEDPITNEKLNIFKTKYNANYTLVNSSENHRFVDAIASELELGARFPIPVMAIYKNGKLISHYLGAIQEEFIESDIKKALGQ
ncbi:MAG: TlpA disulfide reductase family protein [Sulfurimonadaceae bacterium]|jgi:thiol-disulfide isomerase/thioredoxin|nr:TlpA disulfide reductase family protein [Sulfurimonadaceae bacterium]